MFSKNKQPGRDVAPLQRTKGVPSIISADLRVVGDLGCEGDLQIEGVVEGDIKTVTLTIGEQALVKGSVIAEQCLIKGKVDGDVFAKSVNLARNAKVRGDIVHDSISIEAGAYLDGRCRRLEDEQAQDDIRALASPGGDAQPTPLHPEKSKRDKALETIKKAAAR